MRIIIARVLALSLLLLPLLAVSSHAAEKKAAVVLMPLRPTKDIPQDEMTQYEAALVKSLSEKYVVYSGQRVLERVNEVYKKRSAEAKAGKECDETKCLQDVALAFQTKEGVPFVAIANIRKTSGGGYSISLKITDVIDDMAVFADQKSCNGCDENKVSELLKTLAGGGAVPAVEAPAAQAPKGSSGNDMELAFWNSIKDNTNSAVFEAYLKEYPNGKFASLAKIQMAVKSPAQIAAEKAAAEQAAAEEAARVAAEEAAAEKAATMVFVKQGEGGFYMDKTEVTQDAYQRVIGSNPSKFTGCSICPVEYVGWNDANAYCKIVGKRLPTEAEWEFAATSGGKGETWAGTSNENELDDYAWHGAVFSSGNAGEKTHPVGGKKPNGLGLYDMSGNVNEWTGGWYDDSKEYRVYRGGSWNYDVRNLRAAIRFQGDPGNRNSYIGFRCAQSP